MFDTIYITPVKVFLHCRISVFIGQIFLFCYLIGWYIRWRHNMRTTFVFAYTI